MLRLKKYKAFTLAELLVVIAIFGIVVSVTASLLVFGTRSMRLSEDKSEVQFETRMLMGEVEKLIRFAEALEIIDSEPIEKAGLKYVYFDGVVLNHMVDETVMPFLGDSHLEVYNFQIKIKPGSSDTVVLVISKENSTIYELETDVVALNLFDRGIDGTTEGVGFIYQD